MNGTFLMTSTSSITMQSLGNVLQRAPAVGAKTWCLYVFFVFVLFFSHSEAGALFAHLGVILRFIRRNYPSSISVPNLKHIGQVIQKL